MESLLKLRRFLAEPQAPKPEVCELCGAAIPEEHGHVIDLEKRRMMCACRPCWLLFTQTGAAGGKLRSVSERHLRIPAENISWESLDIPVGIAFFVRNSSDGRMRAFYPSPAGATESGLPIETWDEMVQAAPALASLEPDVEALLVCRRRHRAECWIVPVDACYTLVGRIRRHWKGFEGGDEAWREIDTFFATLAERETEAAYG
ncbi:MAG TPA: DUF5947 family protein [Bryobacteraceae bacterium]|jgi:hypothetical protein